MIRGNASKYILWVCLWALLPTGLALAKSPNEDTDDDIIADSLLEGQEALLDKFSVAVILFNEIVKSEPDEAAEVSYFKVFQKYFQERVAGLLLLSPPPTVKDSLAVALRIKDEYDRANKAREALGKRDFFTEQMETLDELKTKLAASRRSYAQGVRNGVKKGPPTSTDLHKFLVAQADRMDYQLQYQTSAVMFKDLCERFISQAKLARGERAYFWVKLDADFKVLEAGIEAPAGEQMEDKLNKHFPSGFDVLGMKGVPVRVMQMPRNGGTTPSALVIVENGLPENHRGFPNSRALGDAVFKGRISKKIRLTE